MTADQLIKSTQSNPRIGWESAFKKMHEAEDDQLLDSETNTQFDDEEWEWKQI